MAAETAAPNRALLTNGNWFIVFRDPKRTFIAPHHPEPEGAEILVFESPEAVFRNIGTFRELLQYRVLSRGSLAVAVSEARSFVDPRTITGVAQGLQVLRAEDAKWESRIPRLEVSPLLVLLSEGGALALRGSSPFRPLPFSSDRGLKKHLAVVARDAAALRRQTERFLRARLPVPSPLSDIIQRSTLPAIWRPVRRLDVGEGSGTSRFYVLTGDRPHFIALQPQYDNCDGHTFSRSAPNSKAARLHPIVRPTLNPRSFFIDRSALHCMHLDIVEARQARQRRGPTSPADFVLGEEAHEPTCFLLPIDEHFCCRSCGFREVCLASSTLRGVANVCRATRVRTRGSATPRSRLR